MESITVYLFFKGQCEEAFHFYRNTFGGQIKYLGKYKDISSEARKNFPNCEDEHIMHATLTINGDITIMGADLIDHLDGINHKNNFALYINTKSKAEADYLFGQLANFGSILIPMGDQFWGSYYGQCIDRYGVSWKVSCSLSD